jgi:LysM repeat protein
LVIFVLVGVIFPAGLLLSVGLLYETRQLILPGVQLGSVDIGNLTRQQAETVLNQAWNVNNHLTVNHAGQIWSLSPVEIGLFLDPSATAQAAYQAGRSSLKEELEQILFRKTKAVLPVIGYRQDLARQALSTIAAAINSPAQDGGIRFEKGKWLAVPGKPGLAVDLDTTLAAIEADPLTTFISGRVEIVTQPVNPPASDFSQVALKLQSFVNKPFKIQVYDPIKDEGIDWNVSAENLAAWLKIDDPASPDPKISLEPARLAAYLESRKPGLGAERTLQSYQLPQDLTKFWQDGKTLTLIAQYLPTTYRVVSGDTLFKIAAKVEVSYWMILKSNPSITDTSLQVGQVLQIPSKSDLLPLPVVTNKRIVVSISKQHLWTYENHTLRKEYVISTGIADSPTMPGVYQIRSHVINAYASNWDLWMPNFMGIYEAWPGFFNGIHGLPVMSNGVRLWAKVLGQPITYGCILMGLKEAQDVYQWANEGVVVEINP